jgi:hypothetical protein
VNIYQPAAPIAGKPELNLDQVVKDVKYPVAASVEGLIQKPDTQITALNDCVLTLTDVTRTDRGMQFKWLNTNPGEYPTYVHVGNPPVIGKDGILYGLYESPDIEEAPITPSKATTNWTTNVLVPKDVTGLYILVSVESKQADYFISHVNVDICMKSCPRIAKRRDIVLSV